MKPDKRYTRKTISTKQRRRLVVKSILILLETRFGLKSKPRKFKLVNNKSNNRKI